VGNLLGALAGVVISLGLYVLYQRALMKARPADTGDTAPWRKDARPREINWGFLAVIFGGGAVLFFGVREYRTIQDRRHPPVDEHRDELIQVAARALRCDGDQLAVQAQEPTLARVEGCGQSSTLRWGPVNKQSHPLPGNAPQWHEIDPNCRFEILGFTFLCQ